MKLESDQKVCQQFIADSENAIQALIKVISMVIETMGQINPGVFYDLQKYHPSAFKMLKQPSGFICPGDDSKECLSRD